MTTRIAINGAAGRMGRSIAALAAQASMEITHLYVRPDSEPIGQEAEVADLRFESSQDLPQAAQQKDFDVLIDFSPAQSLLQSAQACAQHGCPLVTGTTGLSQAQRDQITQAAHKTAIVFAPNMSVGVNLCFDLIQQASRVIGEESDIEILEVHHRHKKDAPSGTSLQIGRIIADTLNRDLDECAVYGRHGSNEQRKDKEISFQTMRVGDVVGEHTAMFVLDGERIEITHKANDRASFARGAIRAAAWIKDRPPGLYQMSDVLKS